MFGDFGATIMKALKDGTGDYYAKDGTRQAQAIELMVDHNLERVGPEGVLITDALAITWHKAALCSVERGGVFLFGGSRYVVEEPIADDGEMVSAVCMELK
ncbi:hypothetical protein [Pseudomonas indica]|uniref:hypothetical protein n=1 Tax=Pseudomonas indica TaxID=137658 RepID=UPI003FD248B6